MDDGPERLETGKQLVEDMVTTHDPSAICEWMLPSSEYDIEKQIYRMRVITSSGVFVDAHTAGELESLEDEPDWRHAIEQNLARILHRQRGSR